MAKKSAENGCVAKCDKVGDKRTCTIMKPIWGSNKCVPRTMDEFDPSSCFEKKSGKAIITICCPKNKYDHKKRRCTVGTRALKMTL